MNGGNVRANLDTINNRILKSAEACGRQPETIRLVAVSKTKPAEMMKAAAEAGVRIFGENYIQEAREKFNTLAGTDHPVSWHFIGHLQSNKAKYAVRIFDLIHSVDSLKLAKELNRHAQKNDKTQDILVQVNIAEETTKSGILKEDALKLIRDTSELPNLRIKGLMTMPPYFNQPEKVRPFFSALRELSEEIRNESIPGVSMDELSMGMTGDFETAIEEGATLIRIGTAIFGERQ